MRWYVMIPLACMALGCASLHDLPLKTSPAGVQVEVLVDGEVTARCTTPCRLELRKQDRTVIRFTKAGYHPRSYVLGLGPGGKFVYFSHWIYYIPPFLIFRAYWFITAASRGELSALTGLPAEVVLQPTSGKTALRIPLESVISHVEVR